MPEDLQISIEEYNKVFLNDKKHVLLDVRNNTQYGMLSFEWYNDVRKRRNINSGIDNGNNSNIDGSNSDNADVGRDNNSNNNSDNNNSGVNINSDTIHNCNIIHIPLAELKLIVKDSDQLHILSSQLLLSGCKEIGNGSSSAGDNSSSSIGKCDINNDNIKDNSNNDNSNNNGINDNTNNNNSNTNNINTTTTTTVPIYVMCRRGIDSTTASQILVENGFKNVFNVSGGLTAWYNNIDKNFPMY